MRDLGFSTGALAHGDFRLALELQADQDGISAVELSALRECELPELLAAFPHLDLSSYSYVSFHAPSARDKLSDAELVDKLRIFADKSVPIVVHPDIITDVEPWRDLGKYVLLENMDSRKRGFQSSKQMLGLFDELPDARFCFDIGHARQVDPTMSVAVDLLIRLRDRIAEIHISEVNWECHHEPISTSAFIAFNRLARLFPPKIPVIIESVVTPENIDHELKRVRQCLDDSPSQSNTVTNVAQQSVC